MPNLTINLDKLKLKNPVLLASGTFDQTIIKHINVGKLGGLITKTVTLEPRPGNPLPHIIKTKYGWLNSVGLKNPGIKKYLAEELPFWQKYQTVVIPSIGGENFDEYLRLAGIFNSTNVAALEVNISCPNVKNGLAFGTNRQTVKKLIESLRRQFKRHLIVKLTPNVTDTVEIAQAAIKSGADSLSLCNTFLGLEIDNKQRKAKLYRKIGGYSGPAIKPITLRAVWEVYNDLHCPIIASGGISNFDDALDYVMVGATAIAVGSANFEDPKTSLKIISGFQKYTQERKIKNLSQIRGII